VKAEQSGASVTLGALVGAWVAGEAQAANSIVATSIKLIIYQIFLFIFLLQECSSL
jgi:hypothetical protein